MLACVFGVGRFLPVRILDLIRNEKPMEMCMPERCGGVKEQWRQEMDQFNFNLVYAGLEQ